MPTFHQPEQEVFIHRHCMQQLLHEAINHKQNKCHGLLTGSGNVITNRLSVTNKPLSAITFSQQYNEKEVIIGTYLATKQRHKKAIEDTLKQLTLKSKQTHNTPFYYLILYLDHKGRIDAHLYADPELNNPITLNMREGNS
ncbi:MAG: hypothetical protein JKY87_07315 [Mariprofundus sp.]|nr:hypothetical protein [Mariprofundus sp.]